MKPSAKFRIEGEDATAAAFRSALGNAQATANRMSGLFKAAFAGISVAAIGGLAMRSIELGDTLQKMSVKAGIGGKAISELAYAAQMADVDLAGLANSIRFMQKAVSEAGTGAKAPILAFQALGLELRDIKALQADRQFELIADRISKLKDPADRSRAATELFGRAGAELLPMFEQGAEGIRKAREEAEKLGLSFSDEQLATLAEADDALKRLKASFDALVHSVVISASGGLSYAMEQWASILSGRAMDPLRVLREEIRVMEDSLLPGNRDDLFVSMGKFGGAPDVEAGIYSVEERIEKLRQLRTKLREMEEGPREWAAGRRGGGRSEYMTSAPPGFADADADMKAAEEARKEAEKAAKKAAEEQARIRLEFAEYERREYLRIQESLQDDVEDVLKEGGRRAEEVFDVTFDNILTEVRYSMREVKDEMTVFAEQAARNMQTAFADFLFDPFSDGLKGMLKGFIDVIRRMVAEVAAAKIFGAMGGAEGVGNFISGLIPGFASGGRPRVGMPAIVGERGPELFVPDTAGTIVPNHRLGGGGNITINVDARGAQQGVAQQLQMMLPVVIREAVNQSRAAVRDDFNRRGYIR